MSKHTEPKKNEPATGFYNIVKDGARSIYNSFFGANQQKETPIRVKEINTPRQSVESSFADDYKMLDKVPPLNIGAVNSINFYGKE